jgi:hypothetical protein
MSDERWTDETETLVEDILDRFVVGSGYMAAPFMANDRDNATEQILTRLADAGLLLPPGGEVREEWAVRVDEPVSGRSEVRGAIVTHFGEEKSRRCREVWAGWTPLNRTVTTWPDGTVHTGPWRPVDPEGATDGD